MALPPRLTRRPKPTRKECRGRLLAVAGLALVAALPSACTAADPDSRAQAATHAPATSAAPEPMPSYAMNARAPRPTQDKVMLGAYLELNGLKQAASMALRREQLGRDLRIIHWFYLWNDALPASYPGVPSNTVVMLSWEGTSYASVINGSQDKKITQSARNLARYGKPVFLRWGWEMNGNWYAWGGTRNGNKPQDFVRAWRHMHDIFVKEGATNVGWVWGPNYQSTPRDAWNDMENYYPGDQYVDWVGLSGYTDAATDTPDVLYGEIYRRYASRKPIMIAETGIRQKAGQQSADWVDLLRQWLDGHRAVGAVVWFDTDTHNRNNSRLFVNFRVDRDPVLLAAYQRLAADPHLNG